MWSCSICGPSPTSRINWCDNGCGRDYQKMTEKEEPPLDTEQGFDLEFVQDCD